MILPHAFGFPILLISCCKASTQGFLYHPLRCQFSTFPDIFFFAVSFRWCFIFSIVNPAMIHSYGPRESSQVINFSSRRLPVLLAVPIHSMTVSKFKFCNSSPSAYYLVHLSRLPAVFRLALLPGPICNRLFPSSHHTKRLVLVFTPGDAFVLIFIISFRCCISDLFILPLHDF